MISPEPAILLLVSVSGDVDRRDLYITAGKPAPPSYGNLSARKYVLASEVRCWGHWRGHEREVRVCKYMEER